MPPDDRDKAYLWDMLDAAMAIEAFVARASYEQYRVNRMMRGAVERHIEIIGEAARRISEETRQRHPEVPCVVLWGNAMCLPMNMMRCWMRRFGLLPQDVSRS